MENKVSQKLPVYFRKDKSYQITLMVFDRIKGLMNKQALQRQPGALGSKMTQLVTCKQAGNSNYLTAMPMAEETFEVKSAEPFMSCMIL